MATAARARIGTRVLLAALVVVLVVLVVFGVAALLLVRGLLTDGIDASLERGSRVVITRIDKADQDACSVARLGDDAGTGTLPGYVVVTTADGERCASDDVRVLPGITAAERRITDGEGAPLWRTIDGDTPLRVFSSRSFDGSLVQVVQPIEEERTLVRRLGLLLAGMLLVTLVAFAHLGSRLLRGSLRPLPELADQLDGIARLGDGTSRVQVPASDDEIARLAERFNDLMARLEDAERTRRSVLADASHELRTPVTALRMNMEVLAERGDELPADMRRGLVDDAARQAGDLARLVDGVVRAARHGEQGAEPLEPVDVGAVLEEVALSARRPGLVVQVGVHGAEALELEAPPRALVRVLGALVDNAAVHGGRDGREVTVELVAAPGAIEVRDDGAGLEVEGAGEAAGLFERFRRAPAARARPGSGLGLAGARDLAEQLGGAATIAPVAPGGAGRGTVVRLELPGLAGVAASASSESHSPGSAGVQGSGRG